MDGSKLLPTLIKLARRLVVFREEFVVTLIKAWSMSGTPILLSYYGFDKSSIFQIDLDSNSKYSLWRVSSGLGSTNVSLNNVACWSYPANPLLGLWMY